MFGWDTYYYAHCHTLVLKCNKYIFGPISCNASVKCLKFCTWSITLWMKQTCIQQVWRVVTWLLHHCLTELVQVVPHPVLDIIRCWCNVSCCKPGYNLFAKLVALKVLLHTPIILYNNTVSLKCFALFARFDMAVWTPSSNPETEILQLLVLSFP